MSRSLGHSFGIQPSSVAWSLQTFYYLLRGFPLCPGEHNTIHSNATNFNSTKYNDFVTCQWHSCFQLTHIIHQLYCIAIWFSESQPCYIAGGLVIFFRHSFFYKLSIHDKYVRLPSACDVWFAFAISRSMCFWCGTCFFLWNSVLCLIWLRIHTIINRLCFVVVRP